MAQGDVFQIKMSYRLGSQDMLNVFYYGQATVASGDLAADLSNEFLADVWAAIQSAQVPACDTFRIQVTNGMNNADFSDVALNLPGTHISNTALPPNLAIGCRSPSAGPGTRYSYKRIGGAVNSIDGNGQWISAYENIIRDFCDNLGTAVESNTALYSPVQITSPGDGEPAWKLGVPPVVSRGLVGIWSFNQWPSHQDTRQNFQWTV